MHILQASMSLQEINHQFYLMMGYKWVSTIEPRTASSEAANIQSGQNIRNTYSLIITYKININRFVLTEKQKQYTDYELKHTQKKDYKSIKDY